MIRKRTLLYLFGLMLVFLALSGCLGRVRRPVANYYVLDYQKNSEDPKLIRPTNTGKILEVSSSFLPKTYDRNQIVVKEHFYRVKFMQDELWADKLRNAIPNLIAQRLRAYNIFGSVTRGEQLSKDPNFYLETNILNIEKVESATPQAYLNMEFILRDSTNTRIILTHRNQRSTDLVDPSMISLVQAFNEMLMEETNIFAAKCLRYFSGTLQPERSSAPTASHLDNYIFEKMEQRDEQVSWGELMVNTKTETSDEIAYTIVGLDSLNNEISRDEWIMGKGAPLKPGRYKVILGDFGEISLPVEIKPRQRSVLTPTWGELKVVIMNNAKTRIRLGYDIWKKKADDQGYFQYSTGMFSLGDDEIGGVDKLWLLAPGPYLVKLGGGHWSDLQNFATVSLAPGEMKTFVMIADTNPISSSDILIGAGVFADDDIGLGSKRWHKGYVHWDFSLFADNKLEENKTTSSLDLKAEFVNNIDLHEGIRPFHFTTRSSYDLGLNLASGRGFNFSQDSYSLKSVLLLYPLENKAFFKNFAFYGRTDIDTHFFDKTTFFSGMKNIKLLDSNQNLLSTIDGVSELKTQIAFYPFSLRNGTGLTYRIKLGKNNLLSLRGGYGWQQDYNQRSFVVSDSVSLAKDGVATTYDYYVEQIDRRSRGLESTVILSVMNLLNFLSINSSVDVLFPMGLEEKDYLLKNENSLNIRIYRNLSVDMKLNIKYDRAVKDWMVYDTSSNLRLSLYY